MSAGTNAANRAFAQLGSWDAMQRETQLHGERRWTAVLCADLVDFTGISTKLGPEKTYDLMRDVVGAARSEIEANGGHIIEYAGDALFAVFGAPAAAENASLDACRAALNVQAKMEADREDFEKKFGVKPQFRIGLAGGSVVFGSLGHGDRLDINVLGDAVNLATRLQKETPNGTVICSDAIYNQVEGFVKATPNGAAKIKGLSGTHQTHRILSLLEHRTYFEGRMQRGARTYQGRENELLKLRNWLDETDIPLIEVSGPAGAGKSRLVYEFLHGTPNLPRSFIGQCNLNIQQTPLAPVVEIIRQAISWEPHDLRDDIASKLSALVSDDGPAFDYLVRRIGDFSIESKKDVRPSDNAIAIRRISEDALKAISRSENTLFIIEDVHWLDAISATVIQGLLGRLDNAQGCRFIATRRDHIRAPWTDTQNIDAVHLRPLSSDSVKSLTLELLEATDVDDALLDLIKEKSDRIPLFVEEIVRYLQFSGDVETSNGVASLVTDSVPNIVTGNLQHLVLSRFDALPQTDRELLMVAAAKGRQFSTEFLESCKDPQSNAGSTIEQALETGLIEVDPTLPPGNWRFSHALIGDAIYQSLLGPQRQEIHNRIARTIEASEDGEHTLAADELAHHHKAAGNNAEAVRYLLLSAEKAYEVFSVMQVDEQLEAAFEMIDAEPDLVDDKTFGRMLFLWARTLDIYGNFGKLSDKVEEHLPRLRKSTQTELHALCLALKALARCHAANFDRAQTLVDEALDIAIKHQHTKAIIWCKVTQMRINVDSGRAPLSATAELYDEVLPKALEMQDSHLIQLSTYIMMTAHRSEGAIKKANEYVGWLENYGRENSSTRAIAMAAWSKCINHLLRDQQDEGIIAAEENLRLTVPPTADWRVAKVGWIVAKLGRGDTDISPEELVPFIKENAERGDASLGNVTQIQYAIHTMARGGIREGWNRIINWEKTSLDKSAPETQRFVTLVKSEIMMSLAGILTRDGPRPKMGIQDILLALRLKLSAKSNAKKWLHEYKQKAPVDRGHFIARIERNLGMIAKHEGDLKKARQHFARSVELYENEDLFEAALTVQALEEA